MSVRSLVSAFKGLNTAFPMFPGFRLLDEKNTREVISKHPLPCKGPKAIRLFVLIPGRKENIVRGRDQYDTVRRPFC